MNRVYASLRHEAAKVETALRGLVGLREVIRLAGDDSSPARFEIRGDFAHDLAGAVSRQAQERKWELVELYESSFSLEETFIALTRQKQPLRKEVA